jgi:hypothetical protein
MHVIFKTLTAAVMVKFKPASLALRSGSAFASICWYAGGAEPSVTESRFAMSFSSVGRAEGIEGDMVNK